LVTTRSRRRRWKCSMKPLERESTTSPCVGICRAQAQRGGGRRAESHRVDAFAAPARIRVLWLGALAQGPAATGAVEGGTGSESGRVQRWNAGAEREH